jgi:transcription elongation factor Elf1/tRNA uridine 5-carbamoylmethylation protein Kti12
MTDLLPEKLRLKEYLERKGISYNQKLKTWRCPNHDDQRESATLYENIDGGILTCHVCGKSWDIFQVSGIINNLSEFKDQLKEVRDTLGTQERPEEKPLTKTQLSDTTKKEKKPVPVVLDRDVAKTKYTREKILKLYKMSQRSKLNKDKVQIIKTWPFINQDRKIMGMDVRLEDGSGDKEVLTFWYNGKNVKFAQAPILIYGLDQLQKDRKNLIHEGSKCAEIGQNNLDGFTHLSWSGGSNKAQLAEWTVIKDYDNYILPDNDDPGYKAAYNIRLQLPNLKIIDVHKIEGLKKGDDIEQILDIMSPDELTKYILNPDNQLKKIGDTERGSGPDSSELSPLQSSEPLHSTGSELPPASPFQILGIGDDGRAAFITEEGRLMKWTLDSISKNKLTVLCGRSFWNTEYPLKNGVNWDDAIDDIIRISQVKDFNDENIRGRGAWRDGDKISYHDGIKTIGEYDSKKIYLRLPRHDIGIQDKPIDRDIPRTIKNIIFKMSFETPADTVRCLGWSVLAPFAGALKFRPALLLTGPSGSGKTTVANLCIRKLANCEWFNGSESTVAGVRGKIKYDSCGVMFEETEADTVKKKSNRDDLFSLMRVNVSDDAPDTVKGTKEGGYNSFKMQNMFGFIAIDPTVDSVADENRIFRVNMIRPKNSGEWKNIENELNRYLTEKNCRAIRALTWQKLKVILGQTETITDIIREKTLRDYRSSYSDAMLASAFMVIFNGEEKPTAESISFWIDKYYNYQPADEHRDEAEEIIERLMNEVIEILHEHGREKLTIMECFDRIYTGKKKIDTIEHDVTDTEIDTYKLHVARYGMRLTSDYELAIQNNHHMIKKIIERGNGYSKILKRHRGLIDSQRNIHFFDGKSPRCTVLKGIIEKKWEDKTDQEQLEDIIV